MLEKLFTKLLFFLEAHVLVFHPVNAPFLLSLVEAIDNVIITTLNSHVLEGFSGVEANLANIMSLFLFQVIEGSVDDFNVVLLVAFDAVGFDQLAAINQNRLGNGVKCPVALKAKVNVRR